MRGGGSEQVLGSFPAVSAPRRVPETCGTTTLRSARIAQYGAGPPTAEFELATRLSLSYLLFHFFLCCLCEIGCEVLTARVLILCPVISHHQAPRHYTRYSTCEPPNFQFCSPFTSHNTISVRVYLDYFSFFGSKDSSRSMFSKLRFYADYFLPD